MGYMTRRFAPPPVPDQMGRGRPRMYPWAEWMNGECWQLRRGIDFTCPARSLRNSAQVFAKRHGIPLVTRVIDDDIVRIQARPPVDV